MAGVKIFTGIKIGEIFFKTDIITLNDIVNNIADNVINNILNDIVNIIVKSIVKLEPNLEASHGNGINSGWKIEVSFTKKNSVKLANQKATFIAKRLQTPLIKANS